MKRHAAIAVLGTLLVGLPACAERTTSRMADETEAAIPAAADQALIAKAEEFAYFNGEPTPTSAETVVVLPQQLVDLDLLDEPSKWTFYEAETKIYFTQLTGDFIGYWAKVPGNEDFPRGHMLYFLMRVEDLKHFGWGIEEEPLDLTTLGEPIPLDIETPISPSPPASP